MSMPIRTLSSALALALALAACGGGGDTASDTASEASDVASTAPTEAPSTEPTETASADDGKAEPTLPEPTVPEPTPEPVEPTAVPTAPPATLTPVPPPPANPPAASSDAVDAMGSQMGTTGAATYASYAVVSDDTGAIQVEIPAEWSDVDGRPYNDSQGRQLFDVRASTDLQTFADTWNVPGVIVTASREVAQTENEVTLLDELVGPLSGQCTYLGREPYDDGLYVGQADIYDACGGTQTGYIVLGAVPDTRAFVIRVQIQVVEERDLEALTRALNSFVIVGDV